MSTTLPLTYFNILILRTLKWFFFFAALDSKAASLSNMSKKYRSDAKYLNTRSTYAKVAAGAVILITLIVYIRFWWLWMSDLSRNSQGFTSETLGHQTVHYSLKVIFERLNIASEWRMWCVCNAVVFSLFYCNFIYNSKWKLLMYFCLIRFIKEVLLRYARCLWCSFELYQEWPF